MSNGKGQTPRKGYNYQRYADNYDQIFRQPTTQPKQLKPMKTNQDGLQPAPVLAWHKTAADKLFYAAFGVKPLHSKSSDDLAAIIAAHDPHAITLGLLEDALPYVARDDFGSLLARDIRAHIADMKGTQ